MKKIQCAQTNGSTNKTKVMTTFLVIVLTVVKEVTEVTVVTVVTVVTIVKEEKISQTNFLTKFFCGGISITSSALKETGQNNQIDWYLFV